MSPVFFQRWFLPLVFVLMALFQFSALSRQLPVWQLGVLALAGLMVSVVIWLAMSLRGEGGEA